MKVISSENKEVDECYLCQPGSKIDSFKVKKIFLWSCEIKDDVIKKVDPGTNWLEYERYLMTRFPEGESKIIRISKNPRCNCEHCKT